MTQWIQKERIDEDIPEEFEDEIYAQRSQYNSAKSMVDEYGALEEIALNNGKGEETK